MSKIMISELQETTSAPDSSYIAIDNGTATNKITIANYNSNANATAKRYAEASQGYANDAQTAKEDAVSAKNEAETLANTASSYANAATASANAAAGSASEASGYVGAAQTSATNAQASARAAEASAADIDNQVKLAKSWAVGNTGVRADEAVNNSMYWAGQAAAAAGGGVVSFNGRTGSVLPNAGDYSSDQVAHVNSDSTYTNVETAVNDLQTSRLKKYASDSTQWDTAPTANSTKPVTSGGVKTELDKKLPTYANGAASWDTTPTANSTKPVTSGGVKTRFDVADNEFADVSNVLGAKNMLPNRASTVTTNGITFTVNSNGSVKATGTATADAILVIASSFYVGDGRKVILSGCPSGGSASKYCIQMTNANGTTNKGIDTGSGVTITSDAYNLGCRIVVKKNQALGTGGITFYPMVRPANIRNANYAQHAKTNLQLTVNSIIDSSITWYSAVRYHSVVRNGNIVCLTVSILPTAPSFTTIATGFPLPANEVPVYSTSGLAEAGGGTENWLRINTDGSAVIYTQPSSIAQTVFTLTYICRD